MRRCFIILLLDVVIYAISLSQNPLFEYEPPSKSGIDYNYAFEYFKNPMEGGGVGIGDFNRDGFVQGIGGS